MRDSCEKSYAIKL